MSEESVIEAAFYPVSCACPDRSWAFPVLADLWVDDELGINAHWNDADGWTPCLLNRDNFDASFRIAAELGQEAPSFQDWRAKALRATALANAEAVAYWRHQWAVWLDSELIRAEQDLESARVRLALERNRRLRVECQAAVARVRDPKLAAAAHRLLAERWVGTPTELLSTAEALLE